MLNLPSYSSVVGLNPSMPESSMRRLIYHVSYDDVGLGQRRLVTHTCRERNYIRFPARAIRTVGGGGWRRGEITAHVLEHVVYAVTVRLAARILTQSKINSDRGTLATFSPHSLASSSSSSSRTPPRALRGKPRRNPSLSLHQSHPSSPPWLAAVLPRRWRRRVKPRQSRRAPSSC